MSSMKIAFYIILGAAMICGCSPSKEEKAKEQKRIETLAQQKADSIVKVEKEQKRIEEEQLRQKEEKARLEEQRNHWTGASSLEELRNKIVGTTWTCQNTGSNYNGLIYKFEFSDGVLKKYSTMKKNGAWSNAPITYSYSIEQKRDSGGHNYISISFGDDSDLDHARQFIAFIDKCTVAVWGYSGGTKMPLPLTYGDYEWNDEL